MNPTDRNKLAFVARIHERRLREIERQLGITSPPNPLSNTNQSDCENAVESRESHNHAAARFTR
jgi:hypothetical protein